MLVRLAPHQPPIGKSLETFGQDVGRDAFSAVLERLKGLLPVPHQVANDEKGPLVADQFQCARDGAMRSKVMSCHSSSLRPQQQTHPEEFSFGEYAADTCIFKVTSLTSLSILK
jgi:hypothetical protein